MPISILTISLRPEGNADLYASASFVSTLDNMDLKAALRGIYGFLRILCEVLTMFVVSCGDDGHIQRTFGGPRSQLIKRPCSVPNSALFRAFVRGGGLHPALPA